MVSVMRGMSQRKFLIYTLLGSVKSRKQDERVVQLKYDEEIV